MQQPYSVEQIKERRIPVFRKNTVRRATLFGSYVKNLANANSDMDLIDVEDIVPESKIDHEIRSTGIVLYEQ